MAGRMRFGARGLPRFRDWTAARASNRRARFLRIR